MNKKFKCIIFDLDGTLIDSGPDLLDSLNHVLISKKLQPISKSVIGNLVGGGAEAMIRKGFKYLKKELEEKELPSLIMNFIKYYSDNCTKKTKLYPNVRETLSYLREKNLMICLCTNKRQKLAEKILNDFKVSFLFDFILGSQKGMLLKPNIEMPKKCLERLNVKPENSIFVGDSNNDLIPAKKLGVFSAFVKYGYGNIKDIEYMDVEIENIIDLKKII